MFKHLISLIQAAIKKLVQPIGGPGREESYTHLPARFDTTQLAEAWIVAHAAKRGTPEYECNQWAIFKVLDYTWPDYGEESPDRLWQFILAAYPRTMPRKAELFLSWTIQDLLLTHGFDFIDKVEKLAGEDDRFNYFLAGVERGAMNEKLWKRIEAVRDNVWQ